MALLLARRRRHHIAVAGGDLRRQRSRYLERQSRGRRHRLAALARAQRSDSKRGLEGCADPANRQAAKAHLQLQHSEERCEKDGCQRAR